MEKQILVDKIKEMAAAFSCCAKLKQVANDYLKKIGTPDEKSAAQALIAEIERDITPIENLVIFAHSEHAVDIFGAEGAKKFAEHADELKKSGAKYCDCAACKPALEILSNKEVLLA